MPYLIPSLNDLENAANQLSLKVELGEDRHKIGNMITPLIKQNNIPAIIGLWVYHLETIRVHTLRHPKTPYQKHLEAMANFALHIHPSNSLKPQDRLFYLIKLENYLNGSPDYASYRNSNLIYIAHLIFEMDLLSPPIHAINAFAAIPQKYANEKKQQREQRNFFTRAANNLKEMTLSSAKNRNIQLSFIYLICEFFKALEKQKPSLYLEEYLRGFALWIMYEIEEEFNNLETNSALHEILAKIVGYDHTSLVPISIKSTRITLLVNLMKKGAYYDNWETAAMKLGRPEFLIDSTPFYLSASAYLEKLKQIKTTALPQRSMLEVVKKDVAHKALKAGVSILGCFISPVVSTAYHGLQLDKVAGAIGSSVTKRVVDAVGPTVGRFVKRPVEALTTTVVGSGISSGMQEGAKIALHTGVDHLKSESKLTKSEPATIGTSVSIKFVDFLEIAEDAASKSADIKEVELFQMISSVFLNLPAAIRQDFDENLAVWYFTPGRDKGLCPFISDTPQPQEEVTLTETESKTPLFRAPTPPPPTAPHPPLSPLRAAGITRNLTPPIENQIAPEGRPEPGYEQIEVDAEKEKGVKTLALA
jgi:hypothetical protein